MSVLFLEYPKCTTCKKAKAWLESNAVAFEDRHIVEANPTAEELKAKDINKAVSRNMERFPEDFYFQLSKEEYENLKFQNGTSSSKEPAETPNAMYNAFITAFFSCFSFMTLS